MFVRRRQAAIIKVQEGSGGVVESFQGATGAQEHRSVQRTWQGAGSQVPCSAGAGGSCSAMPSPRDPMNSADALGGGPRGPPRPIKAALHFCSKPFPLPVSGQKGTHPPNCPPAPFPFPPRVLRWGPHHLLPACLPALPPPPTTSGLQALGGQRPPLSLTAACLAALARCLAHICHREE